MPEGWEDWLDLGKYKGLTRPEWVFLFVLSALLDVLDYLAVGLVPVAGDVIDIMGTAVLFYLMGPLGLVGLAELMPLFDVVPTYLALTALAYLKATGRLK